MKKSERVKKITARLQRRYPDAGVTLFYETPFQLVVSVILSAQCTDKKVNEVMTPYYEKLKTARDFAKIPLPRLARMVKPTGFYRSKARAISEAAKRVSEEYDNDVPRDFQKLLTLRGVARKSANVIYGELTGKAEGIIVDTHAKRLANRLGLTKKQDPVRIEQDLMQLVSKKDWGIFPHLLVSHGRAICTARKPKCATCPLKDICPSAFKVG